MDKWFKSKWFVRGISLVFAIMLYVFVAMEEADDPDNDLTFWPISSKSEVVENIPVEIRINSEKFVVSGVPEFVDVTLEGTSTSVLETTIRQRDFKVYVDLQGFGEGEHTVDLRHEDIPTELEASIDPSSIEVIIEERSTEEFNVQVDFVNEDQLPEGYELGEIEVNPGTVTITSSKSVIEEIRIVKVYIDVAGLTEPVEELELPVNVYDSQGNELRVRVEPEQVSVSAEIDNPSKSVSVSVPTTGTLPEGYSLVSMEPNVEEVTVFATSERLADIEEVETEAIDLSELTESGVVNVAFDLPEGVHIPNRQQVEIDVQLEQTRSIEAISIETDNLGDGQAVSFLDPESQDTSITITGNEQDVRELSAEDFRVSVDLAGLSEGEHRVPITIDGPEGITIESEIEEVLIEIVEE
ncbi:YbbR domain-containing protein [Oceanobacillus limi]|uniref:YbbR domain-containing protein n=1 Tax=Oceanobacillus limi TaxID=930131 RepID=A0A1I0HDF2_9BACI|nr:CdaR family protein [Oceanobacillus limi]SET81719.1 YbbR domain-containing protein [Oceanobacillus limi]